MSLFQTVLSRSIPGEVMSDLIFLPPDLSEEVHVNGITLRPPVPVVPLEGDTTNMEAQA